MQFWNPRLHHHILHLALTVVYQGFCSVQAFQSDQNFHGPLRALHVSSLSI
uniref:Uncharacterized protein n=1 Tax=Arundo donax TaxID=35708 RepID=A0A0A9QLN7_ARUDO